MIARHTINKVVYVKSYVMASSRFNFERSKGFTDVVIFGENLIEINGINSKLRLGWSYSCSTLYTRVCKFHRLRSIRPASSTNHCAC